VATRQGKVLASYRRRLKQQAVVEVRVRKDDAPLMRNVVRALTDPDRETETRKLLREHFGPAKAEGLKALLASASLDGIDLGRARDIGRATTP
jgi:cytochrome P450